LGCREVGSEILSRPRDCEDDGRPGKPPQNDFGDAVLRVLEREPHSSSRKIGIAFFSPRTTILRVLENVTLRSFAPRWIPDRLSDAQKADRVEPPQHLLEMMQGLSPKQHKYLITGDESWISWDNQRRGM
jgi:hypothetical protein